uniref:Uncharacterized protein n=1 Tax=Anguilla anguilla TaxID=7936 RepID=A0A0E9SV09_ANGAN
MNFWFMQVYCGSLRTVMVCSPCGNNFSLASNRGLCPYQKYDLVFMLISL